MAEIKGLEFQVNASWQKYFNKNPWSFFIPEFASDDQGNQYMRRRGGNVIYKVVREDDKGNQNYQCLSCNSNILSSEISHPIWDGPFPCSGSGQVHQEIVPYCPNCEEKPNSCGIPIETNSVFD